MRVNRADLYWLEEMCGKARHGAVFRTALATPSGSHPGLMDEPGVAGSLIPSYRSPQGGPLRFTPNSGESHRASFPNHSKSVAMN